MKGFILTYSYTSRFVIEGNWAGTQGKGLEAGTEAEILDEYQLLTWSPCLVHPDFLYYPGPVPKSGLIVSELDPPTFIINQENDH